MIVAPAKQSSRAFLLAATCLLLLLTADLLAAQAQAPAEETPVIRSLKQRVAAYPNDAEAWAKLGQAYYQLQQYKLAVEALQQAVRLLPQEAGLRVSLGTALDDAGDPDGAIIQYLAAIRLKPNDPFAHRNIGVVYLRKNDLKAAEAAFREALRLKPDYMNARLSLVETVFLQKKLDRAMDEITNAIRVNRGEFIDGFASYLLPVERLSFLKSSEKAAAHAALGLLLVDRQRDFKRAEKEFKAAAGADKAFGLAHQLLAFGYVANGDYKKAEGAAREAIRVEPGLPNAHFTLGNVYGKSGKPEEAIAAYKAAIGAEPHLAKGYYNLGTVYGEQQRFVEAIEAYHQALEVDPQFDGRASVHNNLAFTYFSRGEHALARLHVRQAQELGSDVHPDFLQALEQALPESRLAQLQAEIPQLRDATIQNPTDTKARLTLGNALRETGDLEGALAQYRGALHLDQGDPEASAALMRTYVLQGTRADAIRQWQEALAKDPNGLSAHFMLGLLHGIVPSEQDQAIQYLESFLRLALTNPDETRRALRACDSLGVWLSTSGREKEALEHYNQGMSLDPNNASLLNNLAWLYVTANDPGLRNPGKALELARKAVAATPDSSPSAASYLDTLAEVYYQLGQFDAAVETERKAVSLRPGDEFIQNQLKKFEEAKRKGRRL